MDIHVKSSVQGDFRPWLEYVPVVSTFRSLGSIYDKWVHLPQMTLETISKSRYYTHLKDTSYFRHIVLLVPVIGNITIFIFDVVRPSKPKVGKITVKADLMAEVENRPLTITGKIPKWLSGTLVRNGPIKTSVNGKTNTHMFDGLGMLHAFSFSDGKVNYTNKFLRSDAYHSVFEEGSVDYPGFSNDPRSVFDKLSTLFIPPSHLAVQNANVNVAKLADQYVALTETPSPVTFNGDTLNTLGVFKYKDNLPKEGCWESAHPHYDSKKKETINCLIKFGRNSYYIIHRMKDGSSTREVISKILVDKPSYMHSFAVTDNYIVLTEFPLVVKALDLITTTLPFIKNFKWEPERGTQFTVINRHDGSVVGKYKTDPFFAFHHANAFEKEGKIHLDTVAYKDAGIVTGDRFDVGSNEENKRSYSTEFKRFSVALKTGKVDSEILAPTSVEFPRINEKVDGKPYRYAYMLEFSNKINKTRDFSIKGLCKVDTFTKKKQVWSQKGCLPGEPVFVPAPNAKKEDEGVILTPVQDLKNKSSFLLILDAKTFKEIGRAKAPHFIPTNLHGQYFKA